MTNSKNKDKDRDKKKKGQSVLEKALDRISGRKETPLSVYIVLLVLYIAATTVVSITASVDQDVTLFGFSMPVYAFAGVFSSLGNICVILMTVFCGTRGFITSLILLLIQLPSVLRGVFLRHNIASLPGIFGTLLAITAVSIIFSYNKRVIKAEQEMREQAVTDMLTGLPNMYACTKLLYDLIKENKPFVNVTISINGFKTINDTVGFDVGNKIVIEAASRWKRVADSRADASDLLAHLTGNEFALIIRGSLTEDDIIAVIKRYEAALADKVQVDGLEFYITASFGYSLFPEDARDLDTVCTYSSTAMHHAKHSGTGVGILRFSADMLKNEKTIETERLIREALEEDRIYFELQPQFDMTHRLRGFEALARMKDKNGRNISPGEFIPVAEKVGVVDKIDDIVFRKSAEFFGKLIAGSDSDLTLSINVSVRHLMKKGFIENMRKTLEETGLPADRLEIEITESIMVESAGNALECITELGKMGVKLAIDDFGTGYSSLSYLHKFPANLLKIDKSFIDDMNTSESSREYVAAIISIGHIMGLEVISEGVEELSQLNALRESGCDYIQGFIWGKPLPHDKAEQLVKENLAG